MVTKMHIGKRILAAGLAVTLTVASWLPVQADTQEHVDYTPQEILEVMEGIVDWEKDAERLSQDENLFDAIFLQGVGTSSVDWLVFGMGRSGYPDDYSAFQAVVDEKVTSRYREIGGMDKQKSTEWQRTALAVLAAGGDPTDVGEDPDGEPINLIADGVFDMKNGLSLGRQGINGWIFGLLTLDSLRYQVPQGATQTRDGIITEILKRQLKDGGFALKADSKEETSDVDLTAMAIQALAPYYNSEQTYTYERMGEKVTQTVRATVDEALECLSGRQQEDGGFVSMGSANSESCSQVITALCALGIDPAKDSRFVKDGSTVIDALMSFQMDDGGFLHSREYDEENPEADPEESNLMAGGQAYYALTALCRYYAGLRSLYDFREEPSQEVRDQVSQARAAIAQLGENPDESTVEAAYQTYLSVPVQERCYVYGYGELADQMKAVGIVNDSEYLSEAMEISTQGNGAMTSLYGADLEMSADIQFTQEDAQEVRALPEKVTTENYIEVIKLLDKLDKSENSQEYQQESEILEEKKDQINQIQEEIQDINDTVLKELYPLDQISLKDKKTVDEIQRRIAALGKYDREQILQYEDIQQASVRVQNQQTAILISVVAGVLIVLILVVVVLRVRKRKAEKRRQRQIQDEDEYDDDEEE